MTGGGIYNWYQAFNKKSGFEEAHPTTADTFFVMRGSMVMSIILATCVRVAFPMVLCALPMCVHLDMTQ